MLTKSNRRLVYIFGIFCLVLVLLGGFWDLKISNTLYNSHAIFSLIVSSFSFTVVAGFLVYFAGAMLYFGIHKIDDKKIFNIIAGLFSIIVLLILSYINGKEILSVNGIFYYLNPDKTYGFASKYATGFLSLVPFMILGYIFSGKAFTRKKIFLFLILIFALLISFGINNTLKNIMHRPRYRFLLKETDVQFYNFFERFTGMDAYLEAGYLKEEFKSFPSGHTQCAALMMIFLAYLPLLSNKVKLNQTLLLIIGFIFMVFIGLTRIICGAHFLSDIGFGGFITITVTILLDTFVAPLIKKIPE